MTKPKTETAEPVEFKFVGPHLDNLADGRLLEPGRFYKLDPDQVDHPANARLIAEGLLLEPPAKTAKESD